MQKFNRPWSIFDYEIWKFKWFAVEFGVFSMGFPLDVF